ncbi:MAG: nucleoside/nucleotide kinase family protein [Lachnospiraceae bacterium]|nr:nucleoside/nucleotide kinase family protein [Lachnospiraceae bacterium]
MQFIKEINGLKVTAEYSEESVQEIFVPLLRHLTSLQKKLNRRIVVMLAAPPAAGKSTLVSFLQYLSETTPGITPITAIGMDGFHRYQDYLLTHTTVRNGEEILMVKVKGAPETFDLEGLTERIKKLQADEVCPWPEYSRTLHNPVEGAVQVQGDIVLIEGNYLLLDMPGWRELKIYADYTICIQAEVEDLRDRLINRKQREGVTHKDAVSFVDNSDLPNARLCIERTMEADLVLRLEKDDSYTCVGRKF